MEVQAQPAGPEVIYESAHTSLVHRLTVAFGAGVMVFVTFAFLRGGWGVWTVARWYLAVASLVTVALVVAALRSRTVWRVTLDHRAGVLGVDRDPDVTERWPFTDLASAEAVPVAGGWSRDPADRLVLRLRDGQSLAFTLPDDALTEGIVSDIRAALSGRSIEAQHDVAGVVQGVEAGEGPAG
jgi:hypothetical protein